MITLSFEMRNLKTMFAYQNWLKKSFAGNASQPDRKSIVLCSQKIRLSSRKYEKYLNSKIELKRILGALNQWL